MKMIWLSCCIFILLHSVIAEECQKGECIELMNCSSAIKDLQKKIKPITCGFNMLNPKVCCVRQNEAIQTASISEIKCEEYKTSLTSRAADIPLGIFGGEYVKEFEMPHMAILGYGPNGDIDWSCGGSLISDQFVMTAAHCAYTRYGDVAFVKLGDLDISSDTDFASPQDYQVSEIHVHPEYNPPLKYNDIALLKLNDTVGFSIFVRPSCLHTTHNIAVDTLIASGWGAVEFSGEMHSSLQKVDLKHLTRDACSPFYKPGREMNKGILDESQICAGEEGKDTCQGDSGGPLQVKIQDEPITYSIVGITSVGKNCGQIPGIYTRVSHYLKWIENIVWPDV